MNKNRIKEFGLVVVLLIIPVAIAVYIGSDAGMEALSHSDDSQYGMERQNPARQRFGITIGWDPTTQWADDTPLLPREAEKLEYVLNVAYEGSSFILFDDVNVTDETQMTFYFPEPTCIATYVYARMKFDHSIQSEPSDPTMTCINKDKVVTNDYDFRRHIDYAH